MPPTKPKGGKMMSLINYRLRITLNDSRQIVGQLLAFDAHMNLVLADSQEYRKIKSRKAKARAAVASEAGNAAVQDEDDEDDVGASSSAPDATQEQKRTLGLLILRGENIVSMAIEAPPPADDRRQPTMQPGPGKGAPMGRGMGLAVPPMAGAAPPMMARPMPYARPPPPGMPGMPVPPPGMPVGPPPGFRTPGFPGMPGGPPPGFSVPPPGGFPPRPPPGFGMPPRPQ
ncbi:related to small nuclear ribonucleoprotein associated protein b [Ustilago sp. UG-2017a]|nr:related to small nuclear ribonucleoprotein associated protein b [Ustilago sp. UG-2017a]